MNGKSQKGMLWAGLVLAGMYSFGYAVLMGFYPPPAPTLNAAEVLSLYTASNMQFRIGVALMLIGGGFNLLWSVVISAQLARDEHGTPIWAILQFGAGALGTALFFLPPVFWGVAAFSVERDPALTLLMHQLGWITFITPVCVFPLQAIPIGVVGLSAKKDDNLSAFPRWMGYFSFWMTLTAEAGVAGLLFKTGPFAWNGLFPFYLPIIVFGAWITALIYLIIRAVGRQEAALR